MHVGYLCYLHDYGLSLVRSSVYVSLHFIVKKAVNSIASVVYFAVITKLSHWREINIKSAFKLSVWVQRRRSRRADAGLASLCRGVSARVNENVLLAPQCAAGQTPTLNLRRSKKAFISWERFIYSFWFQVSKEKRRLIMKLRLM